MEVLMEYALPTQHPPERDLFSLNTQAAHSSKTTEQTFTTQHERQKTKNTII
jgi:phage antirepressor YoqD-like protein